MFIIAYFTKIFQKFLRGFMPTFNIFVTQHINQDRHEFYEMVLNYYRARNHLVDAEKDVETLRSDCDHYLDMVWTTVVKSVTVQVHD